MSELRQYYPSRKISSIKEISLLDSMQDIFILQSAKQKGVVGSSQSFDSKLTTLPKPRLSFHKI